MLVTRFTVHLWTADGCLRCYDDVQAALPIVPIVTAARMAAVATVATLTACAPSATNAWTMACVRRQMCALNVHLSTFHHHVSAEARPGAVAPALISILLYDDTRLCSSARSSSLHSPRSLSWIPLDVAVCFFTCSIILLISIPPLCAGCKSDCNGRECGSDGCGHFCGTSNGQCGIGEVCQRAQCGTCSFKQLGLSPTLLV